MSRKDINTCTSEGMMKRQNITKKRSLKNMALLHISSTTTTTFIVVLLASFFLILRATPTPEGSDVDYLEFPLNLEYLEAEFYLFGSLGHGLDVVAPGLAHGGHPPIGARLAKLGFLVKDIILQFGLQEIGHLRAIKSRVKGFPRPLLNLSSAAFGHVMSSAFGRPLHPPFDPYANEINYLLASYVIPYIGLTGYVGTNPELQHATSKKLIAGLLGVESGQDAVIRTLLYERRTQIVHPYGVSVAEFTDRISILRNRLGKAGLKDEGLVVPISEGSDGKVSGNILSADKDSLSYSRTPAEVLRILYGGGDEHVPGGFYPNGADGHIARSYLNH